MPRPAKQDPSPRTHRGYATIAPLCHYPLGGLPLRAPKALLCIPAGKSVLPWSPAEVPLGSLAQSLDPRYSTFPASPTNRRRVVPLARWNLERFQIAWFFRVIHSIAELIIDVSTRLIGRLVRMGKKDVPRWRTG